MSRIVSFTLLLYLRFKPPSSKALVFGLIPFFYFNTSC
nr:MAG TPA: hypothetical protein [Caudoviricetes sp.]